MSCQDEFFSTKSAIGINVGKNPNLGQDILWQTSLKQQIASLKKKKLPFYNLSLREATQGADLDQTKELGLDKCWPLNPSAYR